MPVDPSGGRISSSRNVIHGLTYTCLLLRVSTSLSVPTLAWGATLAPAASMRDEVIWGGPDGGRSFVATVSGACTHRYLCRVSAQMSPLEAAAFSRMLHEVVARHQARYRQRAPVRFPKVNSYAGLAATLLDWGQTGEAVFLPDHGTAVRVGSVAHLHDEQPWPPRGVLAAADGTWALDHDCRVTRLY